MDQNAGRDQDFSQILTKVEACCMHLRQLTFCKNVFGPQTLDVFTRLLESQYPQALLDLRLSTLRIAPRHLSLLVTAISQSVSLRALKLSEINLGQCKNFDHLLDFIKSDQLRSLDLSWASLTNQKLVGLWKCFGLHVQQL